MGPHGEAEQSFQGNGLTAVVETGLADFDETDFLVDGCDRPPTKPILDALFLLQAVWSSNLPLGFRRGPS